MAEYRTRKIALIGAGAVGTSFLYSAMNRGIADKYGIIDINKDGALGNKLDLEDASATNLYNWKTFVLDYKDLTDYNVLVITAGRPQKPGETRLDMIADNARIMKTIAENVKKSGFAGITIIASNPVDVLTTIYQDVTGFESRKVIGSGTSLDSARLQVAIAERLNIAPQSIDAYVLGEHGDSSVSAFSSATVGGKSIQFFFDKYGVDKEEQKVIHMQTWSKAYDIIGLKRATFYGIGSALAGLAEAVIHNTKQVYACGAKLEGEYGYSGFYTGTPAVIGAKGISDIIEIEMNEEEKAQFDKSSKTLQEAIKVAREAIK